MVAEALRKSDIPGEALPFINDMAQKMDAADLLICRAGATTIAELRAARRAAILIPFPQAIHNHQELNARTLERKGCVRVISERDLTGERLAQDILDLCRHPEKLSAMEKSYEKDRDANAARMISETLVTLAAGQSGAGPDV
jgi:UDP-N-acetylglucosamine--N-acetylmuramyl-(pentapeptide) pyrophosphoryl-undecaprenol N-acetylglucosamine transferase